MICDWKSSATSEDKGNVLRVKCASEPSAISEVDLVHNPSGCTSPNEKLYISSCAFLAISILQFFLVQISNDHMSIGRGECVLPDNQSDNQSAELVTLGDDIGSISGSCCVCRLGGLLGGEQCNRVVRQGSAYCGICDQGRCECSCAGCDPWSSSPGSDDDDDDDSDDEQQIEIYIKDRQYTCDDCNNMLIPPRPSVSLAYAFQVLSQAHHCYCNAKAMTIQEEAMQICGDHCNLTAQQCPDARDAKIKKWPAAARPSNGRMPEVLPVNNPPSIAMMKRGYEVFLSARGTNVLKFETIVEDWQVYKYMPNVEKLNAWWLCPNVLQLFQGVPWFCMCMLFKKGDFLESWSEARGHRLLNGHPGVYLTDSLDTASGYAIPHVLFGDDVFHQVMIEVRATPGSQVW